jgi:hypothetical protein
MRLHLYIYENLYSECDFRQYVRVYGQFEAKSNISAD